MGIIPARAGFTGRVPLICLTQWDHPRSRGVYAFPGSRGRLSRDHPRSRGVYLFTELTNVINAGSSPLARGLRRIRRLTSGVLGIIPARAGFTK